jgi:uncharacterized protein YjbI with pentapeptide repeats
VLLIMSVSSLVGGYLCLYWTKFSWLQLARDYYANVSTELASIATTILIIDFLSERRANRERLQQLAREMGSGDNAFALKAAKELKAQGWLTDGSLQGIDLDAADLSSADLSHADISYASCGATSLRGAFAENVLLVNATITGAHLEEANLSNANLMGADLRWSNLTDCSLEGACIDSANLEGTVLLGAKVTEEQLRRAKCLQNATMPDGRMYEEWSAGGDIYRQNK